MSRQVAVQAGDLSHWTRSLQLLREKLERYPIKGMNMTLAQPFQSVLEVCARHPAVLNSPNPDAMALKCVKSLLGHAAAAVSEVEREIG